MMNPPKADELAAAVTRLGIPVFLSGMARGLLGKENKLQMRHHRKEAIKESDSQPSPKRENCPDS